MTDIAGAMLSVALRPRVVHRLPGRLRVHVAALRRVPQDMHALRDALTGLLPLPPGVDSWEVSFATGNLLISYEPGRITEDQVLQWLHALMRVVVRLRGQLGEALKDSLPSAVERIQSELQQELPPELLPS